MISLCIMLFTIPYVNRRIVSNAQYIVYYYCTQTIWNNYYSGMKGYINILRPGFGVQWLSFLLVWEDFNQIIF
jgi:hypothetical protein